MSRRPPTAAAAIGLLALSLVTIDARTDVTADGFAVGRMLEELEIRRRQVEHLELRLEDALSGLDGRRPGP